jgi:hypothetical protein
MRETNEAARVLKWKLMLTTLPVVFAMAAVKLILDVVFEFRGLVPFADVGVILTACVFLIGFLLAGTMADYKESERLPAEIATTLEIIEEIFALASINRPGLSLAVLRRRVLDLTDAIRTWLVQRDTDVYAALSRIGDTIGWLEAEGAGPYASRAIPQLLAVRRNVSRIDVIARTGFLPPAYALLEVLVVMVIGLMLIAEFSSRLVESVIVPFVTLINVYMLRLIRDIDNPFEYSPDGTQDGRAEVELWPLDEYRARLVKRVAERVDSLAARPAAAEAGAAPGFSAARVTRDSAEP